MKGGFRQCMAWLHTWVGLVLGWMLFFMFFTGTLAYFDTEIDRWMRPEWPPAQRLAIESTMAGAVAHLREAAPTAERWSIGLPVDRNAPYPSASWTEGAQSGRVLLDPASGEALPAARATGGGLLLYQMHWRLHYLTRPLSDWIAGIAALFLLTAIVTGVITHKKIFTDFFTFRPGRGQRSWLDAHGLLAVLALPYHLMITYSGLVFLGTIYLPLVITLTYGPGEERRQAYLDDVLGPGDAIMRTDSAVPLTSLSPLLAQAEARWGEGQVRGLDVVQPGDLNAQVHVYQSDSGLSGLGETLIFSGASGSLLEVRGDARSTVHAARDVVIRLHEALFAGPLLRWLLFISGLLGTAMIAMGLVLWTAKRRRRLEHRGGASRFGLRMVEQLNIGTIAGLPTAVAVYFWANRLLPVDAPGREGWEAHCLFLTWVVLLCYPLIRPAQRAWVDELGLAAVAFGLLPVLNVLTTERHLGNSLPAGDWVLAGFDLTALGSGLLLGYAALRVHRQQVEPADATQRARTVAEAKA